MLKENQKYPEMISEDAKELNLDKQQQQIN